MTNRTYFPALRGRFGDWAYYSVLMSLKRLSDVVSYAQEIHKETALSALIQRELNKGNRITDISKYILTTKDRFFNSLVIAVYEGDPAWHEFDIKEKKDQVSRNDLDDTALYSVGYLSLTKEEKLFALDGQHRLAGIKKALEDKPELGEEEVSVIFVAHHNTPQGLRRTRRLFTTLNKRARPVKKSEIIALDEDDAIAIATRHLVEKHRFFNSGQIDIMQKGANLKAKDFEHLTSIVNLYDILSVALTFVMENMSPEDRQSIKFYRPSDAKIDKLNKDAEVFFERLTKIFPDLKNYFSSSDQHKILKDKRSTANPHILFRPIGLSIVTDALRYLRDKEEMSINEAFRLISHIPVDMRQQPYDVIWNSRANTIKSKHNVLCRDLLLYMLGIESAGAKKDLLSRYAKALEKNEAEVVLPRKVKIS